MNSRKYPAARPKSGKVCRRIGRCTYVERSCFSRHHFVSFPIISRYVFGTGSTILAMKEYIPTDVQTKRGRAHSRTRKRTVLSTAHAFRVREEGGPVCAPRLIPWADRCAVLGIKGMCRFKLSQPFLCELRLSMFTLNTRLRSRGTSCHNTRALLLLEFGCIIDHW